MRLVSLVLALASSVLAASTRAAPSPEPEPPPTQAQPDPPSRDALPSEAEAPSALDDWSFIPILFYTPETSFGFGAAIIHSFDPSSGTAALSTLAGGIIVTAEEQIILRAEPDVRFDDVLLHGVVRFQRFPTRFFSDGGHPGDEGEPYDETSFWANLDTRYRLGRAGTRWDALSVGGRCDVHWAHVTDVARDGRLAAAKPLGVDPFVAFGCGPVLALDTRNDVRLPSRGVYVEARLSGWTALYGEQFTALSADLDARGFIDLGAGHVLASQLRFRTITGRLPFQLLPRLGGSNQHRGWYEGHLRDTSTLLLQLEWRFPLFWKIGAAVFASAGEAFRRYEDIALDDVRLAAGLGLRFLLNKKQTVSVRFDLAWGSGLAAYVDVLEAF